jgi:hypothetical protein
MPVTGEETSHICEAPRILHFLGSRLADSGEGLCLTHGPAGRPAITPERLPVLISVRGAVDRRAIERMRGLDQYKRPMASSDMEPTTSQLVT